MSIETRGIHYGLNVMSCLYWMDDRLKKPDDLYKTTMFFYNNNKASGPIISFGVDINRFDIKPYIKDSSADTLSSIYPIKLKGDAANTWISTAGSQFSITMSESLEIGKALVGKMWALLDSTLDSIGVDAADLPSPIKTVLTSIIYESGKDFLLSSLGSSLTSKKWFQLANIIESMENDQGKKYGANLQKIIDKRYAQSQYIKSWLLDNAQAARPDPLSSGATCFATAKGMWVTEDGMPFAGMTKCNGSKLGQTELSNPGDLTSISICEFDKDDGYLNIYYKLPSLEVTEYSLGYPRRFKSKTEAATDSLGRLTSDHANFLKDVAPYLPPGVRAVQGYRDPNEQADVAIDMLKKLNLTSAIKPMSDNGVWTGDVASRMTGSYGSLSYPYIDWDSVQSTLKSAGISWDLPGNSLHQIGMALDFAMVDKDADINGNYTSTAFDILNWFKNNHTKLDEDGNLVSYHDIKSIYYENNGAIQVEFKNQSFMGLKGDGKADGGSVSSSIINDNTINEIYRILKENDFYDVKDSPHLTEEEKQQVPEEVQNDKSRLAKALSEIFDYILYGPRGAISVGVQSQFEYTQAKINGLSSGIDTITSSVESLGAVGATTAVNSVEKVSASSSCSNPILAGAVLAGPAKDSVMKRAVDWKAKLNEKLRGRISKGSASGYDSSKGAATRAGKQTVDASGSMVNVVPGNSVSPTVVDGYASTGDGYYSGGQWLGYKSKVGSSQSSSMTTTIAGLDAENTSDHDRTTLDLLYKSGSSYARMDIKDGSVVEIKVGTNKYVIANHYTCTVLVITKNPASGEESLTSTCFKWKSGSYAAFLSYFSAA